MVEYARFRSEVETAIQALIAKDHDAMLGISVPVNPDQKTNVEKAHMPSVPEIHDSERIMAELKAKEERRRKSMEAFK